MGRPVSATAAGIHAACVTLADAAEPATERLIEQLGRTAPRLARGAEVHIGSTVPFMRVYHRYRRSIDYQGDDAQRGR